MYFYKYTQKTELKNNKNDEPDFYRGAEIQNILDKCYESSENGKWVDI